mmetsp:Transcript_12891/g.34602  ORF Transcript_12891/g.34602 Transcript_12891/m.34602 type:complete len:286 (+) Transcript_12891:134-991(+)
MRRYVVVLCGAGHDGTPDMLQPPACELCDVLGVFVALCEPPLPSSTKAPWGVPGVPAGVLGRVPGVLGGVPLVGESGKLTNRELWAPALCCHAPTPDKGTAKWRRLPGAGGGAATAGLVTVTTGAIMVATPGVAAAGAVIPIAGAETIMDALPWGLHEPLEPGTTYALHEPPLRDRFGGACRMHLCVPGAPQTALGGVDVSGDGTLREPGASMPHAGPAPRRAQVRCVAPAWSAALSWTAWDGSEAAVVLSTDFEPPSQLAGAAMAVAAASSAPAFPGTPPAAVH